MLGDVLLPLAADFDAVVIPDAKAAMMELLYNLHHGRGIGMGVTDKDVGLIAVIWPDFCHLESSCTEAMWWNSGSIPCVCDYSLKRQRMQEGMQAQRSGRRDRRLGLLRGERHLCEPDLRAVCGRNENESHGLPKVHR
jgi:hypothetical protein